MRWDGQKHEAGATDDVLPLSLPGLVRSVLAAGAARATAVAEATLADVRTAMGTDY